MTRGSLRTLLALGLITALLGGCGATNPATDNRLKVVATTPIIADIARQIAGPDADVSSLIPPGADPHTYEPSLRAGRDLAYADIALTNHLLLEEQRTMRTVRATLPESSDLVELSEESERHGAQLLPVVENPALDQLWLGLRVAGSGRQLKEAAEDARVRLVKASGPGKAVAFITGTFGQIEPIFDSSNLDLDGMALPPHSHTHLSWAFTKPGTYQLTFRGFAGDTGVSPERTVTFVVGRPSAPVAKQRRAQVVDNGHADITLDLDRRDVDVRAEQTGAGVHSRQVNQLSAAGTVIEIGPKALTNVPDDPSYRTLGTPGSETYLLPQAVLGKHVHGESDPHVWLNPTNVQAWAKRIQEAFIARDPEHANAYRTRTKQLLQRLDALDRDIRTQVQTVPAARRTLVSTHDSLGYFAKAYGLKVAGFAIPATGAQPGARQRERLTTTVRELDVNAVFTTPADGASANALRQVAGEQNVAVCTIRTDTLDDVTPTYEALMRYTAGQLTGCLRDGHAPDSS